LQEIHQESDQPFLKQCALVDQAEGKQPWISDGY